MPETSAIDPAQTRMNDARQRILDAAFAVFARRGYAQAGTLEIATTARVSKRDLYTLVGKKEDLLVACIAERAKRLRWPADIPPPRDGKTLTEALAQFGYQLLHEVTDPSVVAVFRLAIAEAERAPEIARTLDTLGRATAREALNASFAQATASGIVTGDAAALARQFSALLWGDLMLGLLLGIAERPDDQALKRQAREAAEAFMLLAG